MYLFYIIDKIHHYSINLKKNKKITYNSDRTRIIRRNNIELGGFETFPQKFIVISIDYFSKWIKTKPLSTNTTESLYGKMSFVDHQELPHTIIRDNETQFSS